MQSRTPSTGGGLGYALTKAAQTWRAETGVALRAHNLTVPQFLLVMALYRPARHGWSAITQADAAARIGMDANTASQVVRGLVDRNVIERQQHPDDRRARLLILTPTGLDLCRDASATARAVNDVFFGVLAPEQQHQLTALLESITTASEKRS